MVRMLVTRPEPDASETALKLSALGIEPVVEPLLRYETLTTTLPDPKGFAALVLTSANALRALEQRRVIDTYRHLQTFTVGDRTAAAARKLGFTDVVSAEGDARDLVALLAEAGLAGPVLYPAARERSANLGKALARHGVMVITSEIYGMAPANALIAAALARNSMAARSPPRCSFRAAPPKPSSISPPKWPANKASLGMLCLSETVAAPLLAAHFGRVNLSDHPSEEAMLGLALSFARDQKQGMITP